LKIGFDLMGSDSSPGPELEALKLLKEDSFFDVLVIGRGDFESKVAELGFEFRLADDVVGMHEIPSVAVRQKKNSSLGVLTKLLKDKEIDAMVSAGNTGAILGFSIFELGKIETITRPGLAITFPNEIGHSVVIDVGANVRPKSVDFFNYGIMGSVFAKIVLEKSGPRVALLNVGGESVKGDEIRQKAYQSLKESPLNFIGNIEGIDLMKGFADVIVTDGFTGNVILKFTEGIIDTLLKMLKETVDAAVRRKFGEFLVRPAILDLKGKFNYEEYGGGILLGVKEIVIIAHGHSSPQALRNSINLAKRCIENNIIEEIKKGITR